MDFEPKIAGMCYFSDVPPPLTTKTKTFVDKIKKENNGKRRRRKKAELGLN